MAYIVNESSQNRVKMEMSPSAFKPKMCALTYLCQMGLLERDVGARILGFSPILMGYLRQVTARGWIRTNVQYTLSCVKYTVRGKPLYNKRNSAQCSVMTYKGGMVGG